MGRGQTVGKLLSHHALSALTSDTGDQLLSVATVITESGRTQHAWDPFPASSPAVHIPVSMELTGWLARKQAK